MTVAAPLLAEILVLAALECGYAPDELLNGRLLQPPTHHKRTHALLGRLFYVKGISA